MKETRPRIAPLLLTAVCGIAIAVVVGFLVRQQQLHFFQREILAGAENRFAAIRREADADLFMLTSVTNLLNKQESMTRQRFEEVARAVQGPDSSHAISWLPRVDDRDRETLERTLLASGAPRPWLAEFDVAKGSLVHAPRRAHYYPIVYSVPEEVGRSALGFNAESRPETRIAMHQAIAERRPVCTGPIRFVGDKFPRVAVYAPVWWNGQTDGPPNGFLAVGIRPDMVVEHALAYLQPVGIQITLIDETEPTAQKQLYRHASRLTGGNVPLTAPPVSRAMKVANRTWRIVCEPVMPPPSLFLSLAFTASGLLITFLIQMWLRRNIDKTEHIEATVRQRTEQLILEVAERRRTEAQLAIARDEALEASRMKSEFLANVSHELRTPLNGVVGTTEMLLSSQATPEQLEGLGIIRESANSLLHLISDVLESSRMESGVLRLETVEFDPETVVEAALDIVAERAHSKGLDLAGWVEAPEGTRVRGDQHRVRQVLLNLISNAVKFTAEGSVIVRAWPKPDSGGLWHFEVCDTGIGIAEESQKLLFQRFVQLDGTSTRQFGGTGLGLAISRQIVELMGGRIDVRSHPGEGSTFWFEIPLPIISLEKPADRFSRGVGVVVDAGEATAAAVRWWVGPGVVRTAPATPQDYLLAHASSLMYTGWTGPRIRLRYLSDSVSEAEANTRTLICPIHRSRLIQALEGLSPAAAPQPDLPERHGQVLLVEDNAVNRRVAVWMLSKLGYEVQCAVDGIEALEAMATATFDAVLMDCQMPRMDGYDATRAIRALPGRASVTPVIALTANAMQGDRDRCLAAGMDDYLAKPLDVQALASALGRWIRQDIPESDDAGKIPVVRS